jgi:hypothetical protein
MNRTTKEDLMESLQKRFPNAWFKDGAEFGGGSDTAVWSGEGSMLNNGLPMFNYYSDRACYRDGFGAHEQLCNFVEKRGWYVECYDAGTFFIYPN